MSKLTYVYDETLPAMHCRLYVGRNLVYGGPLSEAPKTHGTEIDYAELGLAAYRRLVRIVKKDQK